MKNCYKAYKEILLLLARLLSLHFSVKNDSWYSGQRALAIISPRDVKATVEEKASPPSSRFVPRCRVPLEIQIMVNRSPIFILSILHANKWVMTLFSMWLKAGYDLNFSEYPNVEELFRNRGQS